MLHTRHSLRAVLRARKQRLDRPNLKSLALGLAAFVLLTSACLYIAAALGG